MRKKLIALAAATALAGMTTIAAPQKAEAAHFIIGGVIIGAGAVVLGPVLCKTLKLPDPLGLCKLNLIPL